MVPLINSKGKKAAIVVNEDAVIGPIIRCAPPKAACKGASPCWKWARVSSPTTMASSTMMPKAMIIPNRLIMLIDPPIKYITPQVANNEAGMPMATQKATLELRNINSKPTTKSKP